jgi:two-component system, LytTR family, sensor histidine kinase AlgZ
VPGDALIPALILQPLIENAVYHGIEPLAGGGTVIVTGRRDGRFVEISVENPIDGLRQMREGGSRIGLDNVRQRLELVFAGEGTLLWGETGDRFTATLRFPAETASS